MSRLILVLMCGFFISVNAQKPKSEIIETEHKGELIAIVPGVSFNYSVLQLKVNNDTIHLKFPPHHGKQLMNLLKPKQQITVRAKINNLKLLTLKTAWYYYLMSELRAVKLGEDWITLDELPLARMEISFKVFLGKKVLSDFFINGYRSALQFEQNFVAANVVNDNYYYPMKNVKPGDVVSFIGYEYTLCEGCVYPIPVEELHSFNPLTKVNGKIKSFLHKQNFVCIGMVMATSKGDFSFSFPSDHAEAIKKFTERNPETTAYYLDYKIENQLTPPELHALVANGDTLKIDQFGFYGGADVKHDHKASEIVGKISSVNKSDRGKIMSIIVGNDCYIEIDNNVEKQLGGYLKKGNTIKVNGDERIKKEGEIYSKDYRLITPNKITINEKIFILNTQPE
jgi:hypothetical protein